MKNENAPMQVKRGSVVVKIYQTKSASGYTSFQVADYSSGKRALRSFSNLQKAKAEATHIAQRLSHGDIDALALRGKDRASYLRATELLRPLNISLEIAALHFAEAVKTIGEDRVVEAARFFAKRHPANLPQKSVQELVKEFIETKTRGGVGQRYINDLRYRCGKFASAFHNNISHVAATDIQRFLNSLKLSPQSYLNFKRVLNTLFEFAKRKGYLARDNDELGNLEKVKIRNGAVEIYSPLEMSRLLKAAPKDFIPSLAIGGFAGLRSAEIERLDWKEVKLADGFLEVTAVKAKTGSRRLIPISDNLKAWLAPQAMSSGKVWPHGHDAFYDAQQTTAAATKTDNNVAVVWKANALRHSFISYRVAMVQNINQVALEAGNSASVIHAHYRELVRPAEAEKWFSISSTGASTV